MEPVTEKMKNLKTEIDGDILTIKVDLTKDFGPSKSGKTRIVASSEGNKPVEWDGAPEGKKVMLGLNLFLQESK